MNVLYGFGIWCALSVPVALLAARLLRRLDPAGSAMDAPDGSAGDLLADVWVDSLTADKITARCEQMWAAS